MDLFASTNGMAVRGLFRDFFYKLNKYNFKLNSYFELIEYVEVILRMFLRGFFLRLYNNLFSWMNSRQRVISYIAIK